MPKTNIASNNYKFLKRASLALFFCLFSTASALAANSPPQAVSISPKSGAFKANTPYTFTTVFSDSNGYKDINYVLLILNTSASGLNAPYLYYNRTNNRLYLRNDSNTSWLGGYAPGSSKTIENSFAKLDCSATRLAGRGNSLTISWRVSFKTAFSGVKGEYLYAVDLAKSNSGWKKLGTITIDVTPPEGSITINNAKAFANVNLVSMQLFARDNTGGTGISQMQFSNDNTNWSAPGAYSEIKSWSLSAGEGLKTVYVRYKDKAGNWSQSYSDTITLDTTPPDILLNPVISPTNQAVRLSYVLSDNFTPNDKILVTGDKSPYVTEGSHNVTITAADLAGNSKDSPVSFTIDKALPRVVITSPQNGFVTESSDVQLQGTVDGIAFSESRSLNPGENTVTKTATDAAGNTGSASVTVYQYLGELIGPEGGEVLSPDGKVKITIPAGALNNQQRISIIPINKSQIENLTPSGKALLRVVECKPVGLNFNIPVTITYTLDEAQIPGTQVSLGLYEDGRIYLTSEPSVVPVDGYTVTFNIQHFSTYAALAGLISQGTPIGAGVKIPLPDLLTGSYSHSVPLTVVPGRKGMQPSLSLNYRSSNPNSWLGVGFGLNPGYIVRSTRLRPPTYNDTQDTFYFISDAGTTELVHLVDNLYQAKVESSFTKFFKEPDDTWKVVGKEGSILRFGQSTDSKETSQSGTFSWYITKAVDNNGNYVEYNYIKDDGKSYLSRIDYTGNEAGLSPSNSVEFILESRSDIISSYISSSKIATTKRLKEIQVKQGYNLVWRYALEYANSPDTVRSLLKSVTQYASDDKNLPVQTFSYQSSK